MAWFLIALIGPFLYALTNHIDKILLEKYFKSKGVGTLLLFSSFSAILALPFFAWMDPDVINVDLKSIVFLMIVGGLNVLVLVCWFLALKREEASVAVVFYQLVPVFGYVLGYFILGEILTQKQLIAMALVIFGAVIISFEIDEENRFKLRQKTVPLMLGAAFFWAAGSVIFKAIAMEENLWRSLFWEHFTLVLIGLGIFIFIRPYRENFFAAVQSNSKKIFSLNVANELLFMLGNFAYSYAFLLAPVALVLLAEAFQPLFVLGIGIVLTVFFPKVSIEKIQAKHLWQKFFAICITSLGVYLLLYS